MATYRSKEKVSAALRKFFSTDSKKAETSGKTNGTGLVASGGTLPTGAGAGPSVSSPSKRLRCAVAPAPAGVPIKTLNCGPTSSSSAASSSPAAVAPTPPQPSATITSLPAPCPDLSIRSRRLMKEFRDIQRLMRQPNPVFTVELHNDNLFEWHARLHVVDPESPLASDMFELAVPHIQLRLSFPENFPFAPPFMRVVEPRIEKGYVMEGGAICMELLTPRGWASAYTVEALLMQFSASVVKGRGRIARHQKHAKAFNRQTAEMAFRSLVKTHDKYGWVTPALSDG